MMRTRSSAKKRRKTAEGTRNPKNINNNVVVTTTTTTTTIKNDNTVSLLMSLPLSLRTFILNLLDGSPQEELRNLPLVSKQFKGDCYQESIIWKFEPVLEIISDSVVNENEEENEQTDVSIGKIYNTFGFQIVINPQKFQHYRHMIVHNLNSFTVGTVTFGTTNTKVRNAKLEGILSLDVYITDRFIDEKFPKLLSSMVPNLRELNLKSSIKGDIVQYFSEHCPNLEKVTMAHGNELFNLEGADFLDATNLKELYIDGVVLNSSANCCNGMFTLLDQNFPIEIDDREYDVGFCILNQISDNNSLKRLSLKNATYDTTCGTIDEPIDDEDVVYFTTEEYNNEGGIPQSGLIKFIRNTPPSFCWFRSDLSKQNIELMKLEKPGIEFVN